MLYLLKIVLGRCHTLKSRMNSIGCALLIFLGLATAVQIAVVFGTELLFTLVDFGENTEKIISDLAGGLPYLVSYIITLLIYKKAFGKRYVPVSFERKLGRHPVAMIFAALGVIMTVSNLVSIFGFGEPATIADEYHGESIVVMMITTVLIPAFCEELMFRGLVLSNLLPFGRTFAVVASGIIFGLIHGNHDQMVFATISGIALGYLYAETGSIWCGIIVHMFNNFSALAETVICSDLAEAQAYKVCLAIELIPVLLGAFSIVYLLRIKGREDKKEFSHGGMGFVSEKFRCAAEIRPLGEKIKSFFAPAMIAFYCYVIFNEVAYVLMF